MGRCSWAPGILVVFIVLLLALGHTHIALTHSYYAPLPAPVQPPAAAARPTPAFPPTSAPLVSDDSTSASAAPSGTTPNTLAAAWQALSSVGLLWCIVALVYYCQFSIMFGHAGTVKTADLQPLTSIPSLDTSPDATTVLRVACFETKANGCRRWCTKCQKWKPDRAHHCYDCGVCTLRLDHHCGFLNNCIGFHTHKYFVLFLSYGALGCLYVAASLFALDPFAMFRRSTVPLFRMELMVMLVASTAFAIVLTLFAISHILIISSGYTTVEFMEKRKSLRNGAPYKNPFNLGRLRSLAAIMGSSPLYWLVPAPLGVDKGRGVTFEVNTRHNQQPYEAFAATAPGASRRAARRAAA